MLAVLELGDFLSPGFHASGFKFGVLHTGNSLGIAWAPPSRHPWAAPEGAREDNKSLGNKARSVSVALGNLAFVHFFPPTVSLFFPTKITFSPDPPLFFPISVITALTKTLTCPSTLGGVYPKRSGAFHDVP